MEKKIEIMSLLPLIDEPMLRFFDIDSDKMLDEKIKVLKDLKAGKTIAEIPTFYDILELYPADGEIWD